MEGPYSSDLGVLAGTTIASTTQHGVHYRIEHAVGRGAMAVAFYAERIAPDGVSPVVLKVTRPDFLVSGGDAAAMMIQKEAVSLGRLNERVPPTPYVVRLVDSGTLSLAQHGRMSAVPWNAVEYIHGGPEGTTLHERVQSCITRTGRAFGARRAAHCLRCIAHGLRAIHEVGVIHRDLSTNNVLCCGADATEIFKIVDFGIARPVGLKATFGDVSLGTPGYAAPEQLLPDLGAPGPGSDVFSLAAIAYSVLTGEALFRARTAVDALLEVRDPRRHSVTTSRALAPDLRARPDVCAALDGIIARATANATSERPSTVDAFAGELLAAFDLEHEPASRAAISQPEPATVASPWAWTLRHQPTADRIVRSVAWDGDGRALAVSTRGLEFWSGTTWIAVPVAGLDVGALRAVSRLGPGKWVLAGDDVFGTYTSDGFQPASGRPGTPLVYEATSGDPADLAVVVATAADGVPHAHVVSGSRWFRPLAVDLSVVTGVARASDATWLLVGRGAGGSGRVVRFDVLAWQLDELPALPTRAYMAAASQPARHLALVVGANGATLRTAGEASFTETLDAAVDLSSAAIDVTGRAWAGSSAALWRRDPDTAWELAWREPSWAVPFVSLHAEPGHVFAMTANGAVVEGRA